MNKYDIRQYYLTPPKNDFFINTNIEKSPVLGLKKREKSLLVDLFFSDENVKNIKNIIIYDIYKMTGLVMDKDFQSNINLFQQMDYIYDVFNMHPKHITESMTKEEIQSELKKYTKEVDRLNKLTVNDIFPDILAYVNGYILYTNRLYKVNVIDFKPENTNKKSELVNTMI